MCYNSTTNIKKGKNMADDFTLQTNIDKQLDLLPAYVKEWYRTKMIAGRSKRTLYEYLNEYRRFFTWLIDADIVPEKNIKDIPLSALENLSKADAECFFIFLKEFPKFCQIYFFSKTLLKLKVFSKIIVKYIFGLYQRKK